MPNLGKPDLHWAGDASLTMGKLVKSVTPLARCCEYLSSCDAAQVIASPVGIVPAIEFSGTDITQELCWSVVQATGAERMVDSNDPALFTLPELELQVCFCLLL